MAQINLCLQEQMVISGNGLSIIILARQTAELIEGGTNDFGDAEFAFATDMNEDSCIWAID